MLDETKYFEAINLPTLPRHLALYSESSWLEAHVVALLVMLCCYIDKQILASTEDATIPNSYRCRICRWQGGRLQKLVAKAKIKNLFRLHDDTLKFVRSALQSPRTPDSV